MSDQADAMNYLIDAPFDNSDASAMASRVLCRTQLRGAWERYCVERGIKSAGAVREWFSGYALRSSMGAFLVGYLFTLCAYRPDVTYGSPQIDGERSQWSFDADAAAGN